MEPPTSANNSIIKFGIFRTQNVVGKVLYNGSATNCNTTISTCIGTKERFWKTVVLPPTEIEQSALVFEPKNGSGR
eukprot:11390956-Karenia_brevis.AAC.1